MTPQSEAMAFKIWAYCNPRGWNCTFREVAEELDTTAQRVGSICNVKGWSNRLRCAEYKKDDWQGFRVNMSVYQSYIVREFVD